MDIKGEIQRIASLDDSREAHRQLLDIEAELKSAKRELWQVIKEQDHIENQQLTKKMLNYYDNLPESKRTKPKSEPTRLEKVGKHFDISTERVRIRLSPYLRQRAVEQHEAMKKRVIQEEQEEGLW